MERPPTVQVPVVISSLVDVLVKARERAGTEPQQMLYYLPVKSPRSVQRFEENENLPAASQLDLYVAAYATEAGVNPLDLWRAALERAETIQVEAEGAMQDAEDAARGNEQDGRKSSGTRTPRAKKRRAG